jgi:hypothetical protein
VLEERRGEDIATIWDAGYSPLRTGQDEKLV